MKRFIIVLGLMWGLMMLIAGCAADTKNRLRKQLNRLRLRQKRRWLQQCLKGFRYSCITKWDPMKTMMR